MTGLRKAFDCLDHFLPVANLQWYGLSTLFLKLIFSSLFILFTLLSNRTHTPLGGGEIEDLCRMHLNILSYGSRKS